MFFYDDYNKEEEEEKRSYVLGCCEACDPSFENEPTTLNTDYEQPLPSWHQDTEESGSNNLVVLCFHSTFGCDVQSTSESKSSGMLAPQVHDSVLQRACLVALRFQLGLEAVMHSNHFWEPSLFHHEIFSFNGLRRNVSGGWIILSRSLAVLVRSMEEHAFWFATSVGRFMHCCGSHVVFFLDE